MSEILPFSALLQAGLEHGGFETDDALRVWLPLCRQTLATHDAGKVAPLRGVAALVTGEAGTLGFDPPRAETPRHLVTFGFDGSLDEAVRQALRDMLSWLGEYGLSRADAYALCSIAADLRVTQTVNVAKGVHCMLPKAVLER